MPSFESDVVLRALIERRVHATIGPSHLGPDACSGFATELGVSKHQLWGAICNLRSEGRIEDVRVPDDYRVVAIIPTHKGERYFRSANRKQPYSLR
ncbi:MAG: hypothetical protein WAW80_00175 [Candidatus Saccharimonadales bacterium]